MTLNYITKLPKLCGATKGVDTSLKGACPFHRNIKDATGIRKIVFGNVVTKFEDAQFFICTPRQIPVRQLNREWDGGGGNVAYMGRKETYTGLWL